MNWDLLEGKWKQSRARHESGGVSSPITTWSGSAARKISSGVIQERYGVAKEAAEKQADEWWAKHGPAHK